MSDKSSPSSSTSASSFHSAVAASGLIPENYVRPGADAAKAAEAKIKHLLAQKKLPSTGWSEPEVLDLLGRLSKMDSNNLPVRCGVGEREGRVFSDLVSRRHFSLSHGIGRSGDLCEPQPKAAGSSAAAALTNRLLLDLIRTAGAKSCQECFLVPMATGMTLTLCLLALRKVRDNTRNFIPPNAMVITVSQGFEPVVVELQRDGDELRTDLSALSSAVDSLEGGADAVIAVVTTTSCFAPRACDDLPAVAKLCRDRGIPHLINNAYGLQSSKCMHLVEEAGKAGGKFDVFVQSTDKNLMVPVGGAIVAGFDKQWVRTISRASASPTTDVLITLLSMGLEGFQRLVKERKENFKILKEKMEELAPRHGERVLRSKNNPISIAMTLENFSIGSDCDDGGHAATEVGSMLFTRGVSGTRVMTGRQEKAVEGHRFKCWGSHSDEATTPYLTAAAAIGMDRAEVDLFVRKLDKVLAEVKEKRKRKKQERRKKSED